MNRLLIAALLLPAITFAQPPDEERRARELLASPRLLDKAWGAYWAGRLHNPALDVLLIQQLALAESYSEAPAASEEHSYVLALFDALIESGATVPAQVLKPLAEQWRDEVLILLARQEGNEDLLLAMRNEKLRRVYWLTVNNLLLRMRSAAFFRVTLTELAIRHTFTVVDSDLAGIGGGSGGGGVVCGARRLPKGFPPIGLYQLMDFASEGYVLVVKGPQDIYYRRTVVPTDGQAGWGVPDSEPDRQKDRLDYLDALVPRNRPAAQGLFETESTIRWHDPEAFTQQTNADLDSQAAAIQSFVDKAKERGLGDLAGVQLTIASEVQDLRTNKSPLPQITPKDFVLQ